MSLLFMGTKVDIFFICKTVEAIFYTEFSKKISHAYKTVINHRIFVTE